MSKRLFITGIMIWLLFFALILPLTRGIAYNTPTIDHKNEKVQSTIISPSVLWQTTVPSLVWSFHLFSPPNSSDKQLIVTSEWQITGLNLTNGNVLWNISATKEFKNTYPKLISWRYTPDGSTLIDSDKDGVPELWVIAEAVVNTTVSNIKHHDYDNNVSVDVYLFAYDLISHTTYKRLHIGDIYEGPPLGGKFYNCTNEVGIVVEWTNITGTGYTDYIQRLALLDSQTLKIVWEAPPLYGEKWYTYWVYDLTGDGYDEIIACSRGPLVSSYISIYDGRNFTLLWQTELPELINSAMYIKPWDIDFIDLNDDGFEDLIVTGDEGGVCAVDGTNGKIVWTQAEYPYYGIYRSVIADVDNDDVPEVITTSLEHVMIFNAITGEIEVYEHLPFYFDSTDIHVTDLEGDGEKEIVSTSFYGGLYIFNRTFGLIKTFDTPGIAGNALLTDINGDGTLEIIVGMKGDQSPVVAYNYAVHDDTTDDGSLGPTFIIFITVFTVNLVLAVTVLIIYSWKKLKHH